MTCAWVKAGAVAAALLVAACGRGEAGAGEGRAPVLIGATTAAATRAPSRTRNAGVRYRPTHSMSRPGRNAATAATAKNAAVNPRSHGPPSPARGATPIS